MPFHNREEGVGGGGGEAEYAERVIDISINLGSIKAPL